MKKLLAIATTALIAGQSAPAMAEVLFPITRWYTGEKIVTATMYYREETTNQMQWHVINCSTTQIAVFDHARRTLLYQSNMAQDGYAHLASQACWDRSLPAKYQEIDNSEPIH